MPMTGDIPCCYTYYNAIIPLFILKGGNDMAEAKKSHVETITLEPVPDSEKKTGLPLPLSGQEMSFVYLR